MVESGWSSAVAVRWWNHLNSEKSATSKYRRANSLEQRLFCDQYQPLSARLDFGFK